MTNINNSLLTLSNGKTNSINNVVYNVSGKTGNSAASQAITTVKADGVATISNDVRNNITVQKDNKTVSITEVVNNVSSTAAT